MTRLKGKVALITGGASGIGEATVRLFVEEGAAVMLADLDDDRGRRLAGELGARAAYVHADVSREADVKAAVDETWEKFGPGSEIQISQLPSQYFFRQCYIATDADEKPLRQVVEAIGDDNIVVSTDYPHSDGLFPVAIEEFTRLEGVTDKTKAKILWDNCARLYKLPA